MYSKEKSGDTKKALESLQILLFSKWRRLLTSLTENKFNHVSQKMVDGTDKSFGM